MCGIAGAVNSNLDYQTLLEVIKSLKRRGPDDDGLYLSNETALLHTRLAVIDIENGTQPMISSEYGSEYAIVYNGELYNTDDVRNSLRKKGFSFKTHSDTEVILKAYICWGEECLHQFNGIFAFAIWNVDEHRLFFARDRMGVKPFFYRNTNDSFIFSSELKGILSIPSVEHKLDINGLSELILIGPGRQSGNGIFKGISELPPAHYGYFSRYEGLTIKKYWQVIDKPHTDSLEDTIENVRYLVRDAIIKQNVSDIPICTFLSGGLDSSIISSVTNRNLNRQGKKLHTFSVHYQDNEKYFTANKFQPNSDDIYIEQMVEYLNSEHHKIIIDTPELVDALFHSVDAKDLPGMADVDASMLLLCKAIKEHFSVGLSGECADEIFGGYPWYRDDTIRATDGFPWSQSTAFRYSFLNDDIAKKINPQEYVYSKYLETIQSVVIEREISPLERRMREMMKLNLDWFMQTLLDRKDRASMYSGLEVRVPFCDYRIVEYMYSVPWEYKDYLGREKGLLRKASEDILPESILWRKKSPYPKTFNPNYLRAVSERLRNIIEDGKSPLLYIVKKSALEKLISPDAKSVQWYGQLMNTPQTIAYFLQLDYWLTKYNVQLDF
ncbi:MAG: asparagine synthase (glutamine-hydrolyzing) [Ruminococcus sp.]|nr:asparagine synthase (glutamine-hydrolyzing) [Ruminococcus sp.]